MTLNAALVRHVWAGYRVIDALGGGQAVTRALEVVLPRRVRHLRTISRPGLIAFDFDEGFSLERRTTEAERTLGGVPPDAPADAVRSADPPELTCIVRDPLGVYLPQAFDFPERGWPPVGNKPMVELELPTLHVYRRPGHVPAGPAVEFQLEGRAVGTSTAAPDVRFAEVALELASKDPTEAWAFSVSAVADERGEVRLPLAHIPDPPTLGEDSKPLVNAKLTVKRSGPFTDGDPRLDPPDESPDFSMTLDLGDLDLNVGRRLQSPDSPVGTLYVLPSSN